MDPQYATVDQLAEITDTMTSLWDAILGLGQRIDGHQAQPLPISGSTLHDSTAPPPPPPSSGPTVQQDYTVPPPPPHHYLDPLCSRTIQFHLHHHHWFNQPHRLELLFYMVRLRPRHILFWPLVPIIDNTQACIDRLEQRIRSLRVSDGVIGWDGYDDLPVAALPVEFRMPDIEKYTGIGCPVFTCSYTALLCTA